MKQIQIIIGMLILSMIAGISGYGQDGTQPKATFTISKVFWNVQGHFETIEYDIKVDPNDLPNAQIEGKASISKINTDNAERDQHLQAEDWFYSNKYAYIQISGSQIEHVSGSRYQGRFKITIKGISHEKSIPFDIIEQNGIRYLVSEFTISLKDYGVGGGAADYVVGDKVNVSLSLPL